MSETQSRTSRRAFFRGSVALGAGVAAAGASGLMAEEKTTPSDDHLQRLQDCAAIRKLQLAFASLMETQAYDAASELFDDQGSLQLSGMDATGKAAIQRLFAEQYRQQNAAVIHSAYRENTLQQREPAFGEDRLSATATYHVDAALSSPLLGESTAAIMARLQGNMASRRWESGRLEASYVKAQGQWKISSLTYVTA